MGAQIYKISSIQFPDRCYIGSCIGYFTGRKARHLRDLRRGKHHSPKLQNHYNKYGEDDLQFEIIEHLGCSCEAISSEQKWIDELNPYFNIRKKAESNLGMKHTPEARAKISAGNRRRKLSEATKKRISEAQIGKIIPPEVREKMSQAKIGKKRGPYKTRRHETEVLLGLD